MFVFWKRLFPVLGVQLFVSFLKDGQISLLINYDI